MINIQQLEDYPDNYDWLSQEQQNIVLSYMNGMQDLANRYIQQYNSNIEEYIKTRRYLVQYNHTITSLTGSKNAYATLGIMVEYNWNNDGKWTLATKADAEQYAQKPQDPEEDEDIIELLDYPDVGQ